MNPYLEDQENIIQNEHNRSRIKQKKKKISYHLPTVIFAYIATMCVFITTLLSADIMTYHEDQDDDDLLSPCNNKSHQFLFLEISKMNTIYTQCPYCSLITKHDTGKSPSNSWECPKCGFPNFNDIRYCGVCGEPKPQKKN